MQLIDLTGKRFGDQFPTFLAPLIAGREVGILVLRRSKPAEAPRCKDRGASWLIRCLWCGKEVHRPGQRIRKGDINSCGCARRILVGLGKIKDLTGKRIARLTVLRLATDDELSPAQRNRGGAHWRCRCECGKQSTVAADNLRIKKNGHANTESCGCWQSQRARETQTENRTGQKIGFLTFDHYLTPEDAKIVGNPNACLRILDSNRRALAAVYSCDGGGSHPPRMYAAYCVDLESKKGARSPCGCKRSEWARRRAANPADHFAVHLHAQ